MAPTLSKILVPGVGVAVEVGAIVTRVGGGVVSTTGGIVTNVGDVTAAIAGGVTSSVVPASSPQAIATIESADDSR